MLAASGFLVALAGIRPVVAAPEKITNRPVEDCPLNSGGPSLLDSEWRVDSVYGNAIPSAVDMNLKVGSHTLTGNAGCNQYVARFQQVGYTGLRISSIERGEKACQAIRLSKGGPTANVGDLESGFLKTLRRMGSVQQFQNRLVFYNRNGNQAIILSRLR